MILVIGCGDGDNTSSIADSDIPRVTCHTPAFDFGTVDPTQVRSIDHTFVLHNSGTRPVSVTDVRHTCGCITTQVIGRQILPRDSLDIPVTIELAGDPGLFQKSLTVCFDSAEVAPVELALHGTLILTPSVYAIPNSVDFGTVQVQEQESRTVKLARYNLASLHIGDCTSDTPGIEARVVNGMGGPEVSIEVTCDGSLLPSGNHDCVINIPALRNGKSEYQLKVRAVGTRETYGLPPQFFVPRLSRGGRTEVRLTDRAELLKRVTSVEFASVDACGISAELVSSPDAPPQIWLVQAGGHDAQPQSANQVVRGQLTLVLTAPEDRISILTRVLVVAERSG